MSRFRGYCPSTLGQAAVRPCVAASRAPLAVRRCRRQRYRRSGGFACPMAADSLVVMWERKSESADPDKPESEEAPRLKEALRRARIESAERTGVVVDLHDAEIARLELLNEALDPVFAELPPEADLFDRGISRGEAPRLWLDAIAHIAMGRDKRMYRFVQDTRYGRKVLAESVNISDMVDAVTKYLAQRLVERERALVDGGTSFADPRVARLERNRHRAHVIAAFLFGVFAGLAALVTAAFLSAPR